MQRGTEIPKLKKLIAMLEIAGRRNKAPVWELAARRLSVATRSRAAVNLNKLNRLAKENSVILVPGKVLSIGHIDKKFAVAAFAYSKAAIPKLQAAGCKHLSIEQLILDNPKGSKIMIVV